MSELDSRLVLLVAAAFVVACVATMIAGHEHHYKDRRWRHLEARLASLEAMYLEDRRS